MTIQCCTEKGWLPFIKPHLGVTALVEAMPATTSTYTVLELGLQVRPAAVVVPVMDVETILSSMAYWVRHDHAIRIAASTQCSPAELIVVTNVTVIDVLHT